MVHESNLVQIPLILLLNTTKFTMKISTTTTGALMLFLRSKGPKSAHINICTTEHWVITFGEGGGGGLIYLHISKVCYHSWGVVTDPSAHLNSVLSSVGGVGGVTNLHISTVCYHKWGYGLV